MAGGLSRDPCHPARPTRAVLVQGAPRGRVSRDRTRLRAGGSMARPGVPGERTSARRADRDRRHRIEADRSGGQEMSSALTTSSFLAALLAAAVSPSVGAEPLQAAAPVVRDAPPRDAVAAVKGTATISGRVTNLETGAPLRRALVLITSAALPASRRVSTNSDGRYEIRDVPPGEYSLRAERGGYLTIAYGQRRPGEPGRPLQLAEGATMKGIDFPLPRVGAISGRVVDETGEPIAHVSIWAMQFRFYQ